MVSGSGSNFAAILKGIESGEINGVVRAVISSNGDAYALVRAAEHNIDTYVCSVAEYGSGDARDREILAILRKYDTDYVILAGYLGIVSQFLIDAYPNRIVNIHPALLPKFGGKGFYGLNVHKAVLAAGESESGATVHFVDGGTDTGLIIAQQSVEVKQGDTPEELQKRILDNVEHKLFPRVVQMLCNDEIAVVNGKCEIRSGKI